MDCAKSFVHFLFLVILATEVCTENLIKQLPSYFPKCYRDDPKLNDCLLKATETMRPYLKKGIPELQIPSISPFFIPEVTIEQAGQSLNYKNTISNLEVTGLDSYKFKEFKFDEAKKEFEGSLDMGKITFKGDFSIGGRILTIPVEGKGRMTTEILNSNGTLHQIVKITKKKGVDYLEPVSTVVKINVGEALPPVIEELFEGNDVIARATQNVIKENLRDLIEETKPAVEKVMTRIIEDVLLKSVYKVPYDVIYPLRGSK